MNYVISTQNIPCPSELSVALSQCGRLSSFGACSSVPHLYENYIFSFVTKGCGTYTIGEELHHVKAGEGFLTAPNSITSWTTNQDDPWEFLFVALSGNGTRALLKNTGFGTKSRIFDFSFDPEISDMLYDLYNKSKDEADNGYAVTGRFLLIMERFARSTVSTPHSSKNTSTHLRNAITYIDNNYTYKITIQDIAHHLHIERSYLYKIFMREQGISPIEFLNKYRLEKATQLMLYENISTSTIALSVGFYDFSHFSRNFQKEYGMSPGKYRKQLLESS